MIVVREHLPKFAGEKLKKRVSRLLPEYDVQNVDWLEEYDSYYHYGRSERIGDKVKRLPVLRVKFNDPRKSWFYLDPYSGDLLSHFKTGSRLNRWVFDALHTLDFAWLHEKNRWFWWIIMGTFMLGGLVLSLTGVWLTAKWAGGIVLDEEEKQ